jgi:hypothetical protein
MEQNIQYGFNIAEKLAAITATPGINAETQQLCNDNIQKILKSIVAPAILSLSAKDKGLII